ncbi:class I SAM-dependent methyltransferase [Stackebrandtia sp.]|jgi:SAM-dependent methyltransferase|uniref:class I SAM-dependent methyltransferase n=1 Tax=Stackebrandtia sp. TaxID=2023065 RepID=UPI0032C21456
MKFSPRNAVVWRVVLADLARQGMEPGDDDKRRIVDVGGGTGGFAVPLARAGYHVTVIDTSPNALAGLDRRAADAGVAERITGVQGDADALPLLVEAGAATLVLCHSVLEMVESPRDALRGIATALAPGGAASVLVANRAGAVLARALGGHVSTAATLLSDPDGRVGPRDTLLRRFDPEPLERMIRECGLEPELRHGVQVTADKAPGTVHGGEIAQNMIDFERELASRSPYRDIATQLHVLARKPR